MLRQSGITILIFHALRCLVCAPKRRTPPLSNTQLVFPSDCPRAHTQTWEASMRSHAYL